MPRRAPSFYFSRLTALVLVITLTVVAVLALTDSRGGLVARPQAEAGLAEQLDSLFSEVAKEVRECVVAVGSTESLTGASSEIWLEAEGLPPTQHSEFFGSGFVIDPRGYILTNHHLVGSSEAIRVRFCDGVEVSAALVQSDPASDIALLKVERQGLSSARLGNSETVRVGQWVLAVGNPFGLLRTVSTGIVSALRRSDLHLLPHESFIQTDAAINPGNSGGPLVNLRGEVIGINTAIYSGPGKSNNGIGFAVPINLARVLAELWKEGKSAGFLGIEPVAVDQDMAKYFGLEDPEGVFVKRVDPQGPAAMGGMWPMDLISRFAGEEVRDLNHLRVLVATQPLKKEVIVEVRRQGRMVQLKIVLEPRTLPPQPAVLKEDRSPGRTRLLGITVAPLTNDLSQQLGSATPANGMVVIHVDPRSSAWRKGLRPADVILEINEVAVSNLNQLHEALKRSPDTVVLHVLRGGGDLGYFFLSR